MTTRRARELVARLTLDEKAALTAGADLFTTVAVPRLGIPSVGLSDGPAGARGATVPGVGQERSAAAPCGTALGATWDPEIVAAVGAIIGDEARAKGCPILLAPTVNLHRSPLGGRTFEAYAEDPVLTGRLAAAFVRGAQGAGVVTTVKHFVGNEAEEQRMTADSRIDERTLRELYLLPFELAIRDGGANGLMTAYNRLNGTWCSEHADLLAVAREEWGFDGLVVTDRFAGAHTAAAARAGLDLEMPGPGRAFGPALAEAVRASEVDEAAVDRSVGRLLGALDLVGALDQPGVDVGRPPTVDTPAIRATLHDAAAAAMVLLHNDGTLPLEVDGLGSVAVIGPNAGRAQITGGGSAAVRAHRRISPLRAISERLADRVTVVHEPGCALGTTSPVLDGTSLRAPGGGDGLTATWFATDDWSGEEIGRTSAADTSLLYFEPEVAVPAGAAWSLRAEATFTTHVSGPHRWTLAQGGRARLLLDGEVVLDGTTRDIPPGDAFFGLGSAEIAVDRDLEAGRAYALTIELTNRDATFVTGARVGCAPVVADDSIDRAAALAAAADVAVVVVGSDDTWETEGRDRPHLGLPGAQDALVAAVAAANPRTIVVVNTGAPVLLPWRGDVAAVLQVWFGGQEMAPALAAVLVGDEEPGGRLPITIPTCLEHTPAHGRFRPDANLIHYGEGVFVGHRWYDHRALPVTYPFGHGLSYTTFAIGAPVDPPDRLAPGQPFTLRIPVRNTGDRIGSEVVQAYVHPVSPSVDRPPKELKAFAKVRLAAGDATVVDLAFDDRAFARWDLGDAHAVTAFEAPPGQEASAAPPTGRGPGWWVEPGVYEVWVGRSATDIAYRHPIRVG